MIISLVAEKRGVDALACKGRLRPTFARKLLWPRGRMRSLEEPALVAELRSFRTGSSKRSWKTHQFPRTERRAAPRRCLSAPAIEALAAYGVAEFHPHVVRVDRPVGFEPGKTSVDCASSAVERSR
jgi:hypothetical protein